MTQQELHDIEKWVRYLTKLFVPYGTYDTKAIETIIKSGKMIAIGTFELIRADEAGSILKMFNDIKSSFEKTSGMKLNGDIDFYFGYCKVVGENIALGTPEKIDKLLEGTLRIVK